MLGLGPDTAALRKVRVRSAERDTLCVRRQFERALRGAEWMPPGVRPGAVLLVRRLALACGSGPAGLALDRRVSQAMRDLAQHAHRPWLHGDAAEPEAILFADEAELVACLVRDWLRGVVAQRWWWRSLLLAANAREWLRREALQRPDRLVPAIAKLATQGQAVAFVARLEPAECMAASAAVARAFAVPLAEPVAAPSRAAEGVQRAAQGVVPAAGRHPASELGREAVRRLLQEAPELGGAALRFEQRRLLALALVLTRAPTWARGARMAMALQALRDPLPVCTDGTGDPGAMASSPAGTEGLPVDPPVVRQQIRPPARQPGTVSTLPVQGRPPGEPATPGPRGAPPPRHAAPGEPVAPGSTAAGAAAEPSTGEVERLAEAAIEVLATRSDGSTPDKLDIEPAPRSEARGVLLPDSPVARSRVASRFGGLFYLLNAALALGLYGDFTRPLSRRLTLSPWDWLALVGRAWFGDAIVEDGAWRLLAGLAGREEDEEPGRDFEPPTPEWLEEHLVELEARLALAVGVPQGEALRAMVCRHEAGIEVDAASVHVFLALDELPLAIRVAGLDRDPGWIPAAGHDVRFFFA